MAITLDGTNGITTPGPSVVEANTSDAALRITQVGSGNALLVEDSANPDSTPVVIDADGKLVAGSTTANIAGGFATNTNIQSFANGQEAGFSAARFGDNSIPAVLHLGKARGTISSPAAVQSGDDLGFIRFAGYDGNDFQSRGGEIRCEIDGTPSADDMPGRLVFSTTADGASIPTEQMRITSTGDLRFNSGYGSVATAYGCRAWVNFNGTGTVAIREDGNVTSITDNGTGIYTVNFTTAMPDANYGASVSVSSMPAVSDANMVSTDCNNTSRTNPTTSAFRITTFNAQFQPIDIEFIRVAIFR